jgi:WD40 repeat protein
MNGEIYLWNISQEDPQIAVSQIDEYFHREAITRLVWVKQESLSTMQVKLSIVSTSTDGKILVWRFQDKLKYPIKGHLLAAKKGADSTITGGTALDKVC